MTKFALGQDVTQAESLDRRTAICPLNIQNQEVYLVIVPRTTIEIHSEELYFIPGAANHLVSGAYLSHR